ncbi:hypothetical protein WJX81_005106 [Elliptochloris bilobata]|uniref:GrpE protein homolog n=1 Tax=Elliptochloris bilobata TaxID=381761 RepID=A0AAW1S3S6_9CHLO
MAALSAKDKEVRDLRERNLRVLADMENLRERSAKAAQSTKQYAIQGFVKDVVEVADNLQRAAETVPGSVLEGKDADGQPLAPERALALLQSLLQGVHLTERVLQQTLKKNGVERYAPEQGDAFNHDLHNAMFDVPAPPAEGMDPGRIAMLIKNGYTLNGRVVRPADVATFRASS